MLRVSVGLESAEALWEDLSAAIAAAVECVPMERELAVR